MMEYYLAVKMNELELNTLTWMNIVDIVESKIEISWEDINMSPFT